MFGIWDFFGILAGAGVAAGGAAKELIVDPIKDANGCLFVQEYIEKHSDTKLEESLMAKIEDPAYYDWVWERLESYKRSGGVNSRDFQGERLWQSVGHERLPFRSKNGYLHVRNKYEDMMLDGNRNSALTFLMHSYGKKTVRQAKIEAQDQLLKMYQKRR